MIVDEDKDYFYIDDKIQYKYKLCREWEIGLFRHCIIYLLSLRMSFVCTESEF